MIAKTGHFALHRTGLDATDLPPTSDTSADRSAPMARLFPVKDTWIGAMVPKRWAKRAVTRNAIKRQIYTVSADFLDRYAQAAFVVRLRSEFTRKEFISASSEALKEAVRHEIEALMRAGAGSTRPLI